MFRPERGRWKKSDKGVAGKKKGCLATPLKSECPRIKADDTDGD